MAAIDVTPGPDANDAAPSGQNPRHAEQPTGSGRKWTGPADGTRSAIADGWADREIEYRACGTTVAAAMHRMDIDVATVRYGAPEDGRTTGSLTVSAALHSGQRATLQSCGDGWDIAVHDGQQNQRRYTVGNDASGALTVFDEAHQPVAAPAVRVGNDNTTHISVPLTAQPPPDGPSIHAEFDIEPLGAEIAVRTVALATREGAIQRKVLDEARFSASIRPDDVPRAASYGNALAPVARPHFQTQDYPVTMLGRPAGSELAEAISATDESTGRPAEIFRYTDGTEITRMIPLSLGATSDAGRHSVVVHSPSFGDTGLGVSWRDRPGMLGQDRDFVITHNGFARDVSLLELARNFPDLAADLNSFEVAVIQPNCRITIDGDRRIFTFLDADSRPLARITYGRSDGHEGLTVDVLAGKSFALPRRPPGTRCYRSTTTDFLPPPAPAWTPPGALDRPSTETGTPLAVWNGSDGRPALPPGLAAQRVLKPNPHSLESMVTDDGVPVARCMWGFADDEAVANGDTSTAMVVATVYPEHGVDVTVSRSGSGGAIQLDFGGERYDLGEVPPRFRREVSDWSGKLLAEVISSDDGVTHARVPLPAQSGEVSRRSSVVVSIGASGDTVLAGTAEHDEYENELRPIGGQVIGFTPPYGQR